LLGIEPYPIVDTQIAAAFAGLGYSLSYQNLIASVLQIEIDKEQTRSDWLQRPLTEKQIQYAANDVRWLPQAWLLMQEQLKKLGRLAWCLEDCESLYNGECHPDDNFDSFYLRLKSAWRLSRQELHVLRALCAWREELAQQKDVPRSRIINDACALELAQRQPKEFNHFYRLQELRSSSRKTYGEEILALIVRATQSPSSEWPDQLMDKSAPSYRKKLKRIKAMTVEVAEAHQLPPEIVARKKQLEEVIESGSTNSLQGWREGLLQTKIIDIL